MSKRAQTIPAIPNPTPDPKILQATASALKEAVEVLAGQRGAGLERAVTLNDLIRLGLVTEAEVTSKL